MSDLISREEVSNLIDTAFESGAFDGRYAYENLVDAVQNVPSVESERKPGKWIWDKRTGTYHCSECGHDPLHEDVGEIEEYKYCMNCGAKMEVEGCVIDT